MTLFAAASCLVAASLASNAAAELAVLFSALIATGNGVFALLLSHLGSQRQSLKGFFGAVFGGMVLRMGTTLGGFAIGLKVLLLPPALFAATLLTFTTLFTAAEVALWSRQDFSPRVQPS